MTEPLVTALAEELDGHLPRMAFRQYGQFYNDDPDFDIEAYYLRAAAAILPRFLASPAFTEPTTREWLEHAKHGVESLDTLYHDGGADGRGITVREFRAGRDFILQQIDAALAALDGEPR